MSTARTLAPLIDTDVWIDFLRGHAQAVAFVASLPEQVFICAISVAELHAGVRDGAERKALAELLSTLEVVPLSAAIAERGGLLRRDFGPSHAMGLNDALLAASALALGLQLFSLNLKHYPAKAVSAKKAYAKRP